MPDKDEETVETFEAKIEGKEEESSIKVIVLDTAARQFFIAKEDDLPGHICLVNFFTKLAFAIPVEMAHHLSHMLHDALEVLAGGDIDEATEPPKKQYLN